MTTSSAAPNQEYSEIWYSQPYTMPNSYEMCEVCNHLASIFQIWLSVFRLHPLGIEVRPGAGNERWDASLEARYVRLPSLDQMPVFTSCKPSLNIHNGGGGGVCVLQSFAGSGMRMWTCDSRCCLRPVQLGILVVCRRFEFSPPYSEDWWRGGWFPCLLPPAWFRDSILQLFLFLVGKVACSVYWQLTLVCWWVLLFNLYVFRSGLCQSYNGIEVIAVKCQCKTWKKTTFLGCELGALELLVNNVDTTISLTRRISSFAPSSPHIVYTFHLADDAARSLWPWASLLCLSISSISSYHPLLFAIIRVCFTMRWTHKRNIMWSDFQIPRIPI